MRLLPDVRPRPRLLESAAPEPAANQSAESSPGAETGKRLSRLLVRILVVALIASAVAYWIVRRESVHEEAASNRRLLPVGTDHVSAGPERSAPPQPIVVQLNEDLIQVTTIALGHPRLAVINGKQVAEGDTITIHTPSRSVATTLRVVQISDRNVNLTDGTQVITAHLLIAKRK